MIDIDHQLTQRSNNVSVVICMHLECTVIHSKTPKESTGPQVTR